jgi:hypothetical protein
VVRASVETRANVRRRVGMNRRGEGVNGFGINDRDPACQKPKEA